ncbi:MAG: Uma2 family endonuclease [bacterium]
MTEDEYLSLQEEKPYLEYVDGVVLQKPMANHAHLRLAGELIISRGIYGRANGGIFGPEGRVRGGDLPNYRLPDVSYWARGTATGNDCSPTLAIEIRSPGQTMLELRQKCRDFRRTGVDARWIIDPSSRTAESFGDAADAQPVTSAGTLRSRFVPDFEVSLAELFRLIDE